MSNSENTKEKDAVASAVNAIVMPPKFVPVVMCEDNNYVREINEGMADGLRIFYESQIFPQKGDIVFFKGHNPDEVTERVFLPIPDNPLVYLFTPFWSKEYQLEYIYEKLMDEKHEGNEFKAEDDEDYLNKVKHNVFGYHDTSAIYRIQKQILGA